MSKNKNYNQYNLNRLFSCAYKCWSERL